MRSCIRAARAARKFCQVVTWSPTRMLAIYCSRLTRRVIRFAFAVASPDPFSFQVPNHFVNLAIRTRIDDSFGQFVEFLAFDLSWSSEVDQDLGDRFIQPTMQQVLGDVQQFDSASMNAIGDALRYFQDKAEVAWRMGERHAKRENTAIV